MRNVLAIFLFLFILMDKAWAIPEVKLVQGTAVLPDEGRGLYKITGEAEMIWDQLSSPDEFTAGETKVRLVPFPDVWSALEHDGLSRQGKATYRMTIHLPESLLGERLGLWLPRSLGSSTIWMNNKKIIEHDFGPDGTDLFDRSPGHNRIFIVPREKTLQFVIQTFNWHMHTGGFVDRFLIGRAEDLQKISFDLMAFDFLVFGLLVFSSIYHLWLFTFRRKFEAYRDLGLFFLLVVARMLSTGSSHWLSELGCNEMIVYKLGWLTYYGGILVGVHLIRSIYPDETPGLLVKVARVVAIITCAIVFFTPLSFSHILLRPMQIFTIAIIGPVMWTLFRAYLNRRQGTLVLLPATALLLAMALVEIYNSVNKIDQNYSLLGVGMLLFSLGASISQSVSFDRTFHRVERQTRGINSLNQKLRKQAEILERRIHQTTEEMSTLLHNLPEGVLLIEGKYGHLEVGSYLSQSMKRILGADTITWPLVQNFFLETHLDSDQRAQLEATLGVMIGDDAISFELNAENLPKELLVIGDKATQSYLCAWAPVVLDGSIHSILLVLVDVSSERSVYHQFEMEQQIFDRMLQLLTTESDNLPVFMQEAQQIMRRLESGSQDSAPERSPALLRELHTLKGLARGFGLLGLARTAHEMEERLLRQPLSRLDTLFTVWASHQKAFSMLGFSSQNFPAREKEEDLLLVCGQVLFARFEAPSDAWQTAWQNYVKSLFIRLDDLVASVEEGLASVAQQLGKPKPRLIIEGGEVGIRRSIQGKLLGGLTHILRNALDHGLENAEERRAQNKPGQGSIFITLHFREKILIEVHDDGRGLNLHSIRRRALEKGLISADQDLSDEQLVQFVFAPGFSTKTAVNDISGRGLGMDAVQAAMRQMGGQIRIVWRSRKNEQGFRQGMWCISLPRRYGFHEVAS
ncbi:MAG TPA: ATP-binding protein [Oligoflexus sp.]|uniref:ATP-binding protein n=1 Tax=Oligoflexus sp. TaxID=1971216 RepID=UPI002D7F6E53|nr:ATP-binding protein [Oligoflexus sp.]HET9235761.1 ATP-binding protein [Oligoflexus sp.]